MSKPSQESLTEAVRRLNEILRADLDAHKAAVAEAVRRVDQGTYGLTAIGETVRVCCMDAVQPLRALAEPAKQPEGDALEDVIREAWPDAAARFGDKIVHETADSFRKALAARGLSVKGEQ